MDAKKSNSREVILEVAAQLFAKQGYHGTTLNQIIEVSGSPKGSLYYYFPSKETLAIACVKLTQSRLLNKLQEQIRKLSRPEDFMQAFVLNMADAIDNYGTDKFVPFGFLAAAETSSVSDSLRNACQSAFAEWKNTLSGKLVETGVSEERAIEMAEIAVCLIEGAIIMSVVERSSRAMRRAASHVPAIFQK